MTTRTSIVALVFALLCAFQASAQKVEVTESSAKTEVIEGGASDTYTVVLTTQPTANVTVTLTVNTVDLSTDKTVLTFTTANWSTAQIVTVTAVDDLLNEGPETSPITHSAASSDPAYNSIFVADVLVSIVDNDDIKAAVNLTESSGKTEVVEGGAGDSYTVVLSTQPSANVTVALSFDAAQISASPLSLTFTPANWATPQTVNISALNDSVAEGLLIYPITHTASSTDPDYEALYVSQVSVSVVDNDSVKPEVNLAESGGTTGVIEGGAGDSYLVVLATQPSADVTVTLSVNASQLNTDKTVLTFTPANWNISQTVAVSAVDDFLDEGLHLSSITHTAASSDPDYNGLYVPELVASITDNDKSAVTITQSGGTSAVAEGGTNDSYQVVLTTQPSANVTITVTVPIAQLQRTPTSLTFNPGNWNLAQTVTVSAVDDSAGEGTHSAIIWHAASSADENYNGMSMPQVVVLIFDNDAVLAHSPSSLTNSVVHAQNATNQSFTVWNSGGSTLNYTNTVNQSWLSVAPTNGTSTGEQDTIQVSYTTAGLPAGTNYATITIKSQVATNTIPVTLIVIPAINRIIGLNGNLAFGNVVTNTTAQRTLTITNSGNAALTVTGFSYPPGFSGAWSGNIPAGSFQNVTVTFAPTAVTTYSGTVTVNSDATSGVNSITASGTGTATPPQTGSLQVSLAPAGAVSAGAQWRVDNGVWQNSGATVSGLSVGNHSVTFNTVAGWTTPTSQNVTVSANVTNPATGTYVEIPQTPMQLTGMALSNGVFRFTLNGPVGSNYVIQVSSNLVNWLPLVTNTIPASGWVLITDSNVNNQSRRFYRAIPLTVTAPTIVPVAQISNGGYARSVVVTGDHAYLANEIDGLRVYNISNPVVPINVGLAKTGDMAWGIAVAGNVAYLANFDSGLRTYGISDPTNPAFLGQIDNGGQARGVAVAGGYAYLANNNDGLRIYNIANPANLISVSRTNNGGLALGVAVAGNYAYLANDADGLRVYDISNPANPVNVGRTNDAGMAKGVTVAGNYAYLANGNDGLRIYDVSNPANPLNIAHIDEGGQARFVAVQGNYAYLANLDDGLRIYDISNPASPISVGHVDDGGTANGVAVSGNYIYLANGDDGLRIYSFSNGPP